MRLESRTLLNIHYLPAVLAFVVGVLLTAQLYQYRMGLATAAYRQEAEQSRSELESVRQQADELDRAHKSLQQAYLVQQEQLRQAQDHVHTLEEQLQQAQLYIRTLEEQIRAAPQLPQVGQPPVSASPAAAEPATCPPPAPQLTGPQQGAIAATGSFLLLLCVMAASGSVRGLRASRSRGGSKW